MKNDEMSFEEMTARINEIVALLENTNTPLDKSLSLFDDAQKKVKMLTEEEVK